MTTLNLGVIEVAYSDASGGGAKTTGDVAQILEDKYHVMMTFYETRKDKIDDWLAGSVADAVDILVSTGRNVMPTLEAEQKIETEFRAFLDANEMGTLSFLSEAEREYFLANSPAYTGAANAGVSHRKKNPYAKKNKPRPVFVDTGLYQDSFRAWVSED